MPVLSSAARRYLAALFWSVALPVAASAQPLDPTVIDTLVKEQLQAWQVPGAAVVIVRGDRVLYLKGHGVRDLSDTKPVTPDTVFPLASCSKAFTSTAVALLVDEGKMQWDDPVRKHLPYFHLSDPLADANVTIRDLMCHRTGVASHDLLWYRATWTPEEAIRRLAHLKPNRSFRSAFQYQSCMFTAAGYAVGQAAGTSWRDFVQKRIFDPLEMTGASFTTAEALKAPDHAMAHRKTADGKIEPAEWYPFAYPEPAGSLNVCARDLGKWLQFQLGDGTFHGKRLLSTGNLHEPHMAQFALRMEGLNQAVNPYTLQMNYGLAWVIQDHRGHLMVSHAGAIDGFRAHITLLPREKLGIAVLTNLGQTRMNIAVSYTLVDLLLGQPQPARDWSAHFTALVQKEEEAAQQFFQQIEANRQKGTKPSLPLSAYTGSYEEPAYGKALVVLDKGTLFWEWSGFRLPLEHYHYDTFLARHDSLFGTRRFVFTSKTDGTVTGVQALDVEFKKNR